MARARTNLRQLKTASDRPLTTQKECSSITVPANQATKIDLGK